MLLNSPSFPCRTVHLSGLQHVNLHTMRGVCRSAGNRLEYQKQKPACPVLFYPSYACFRLYSITFPHIYIGQQPNRERRL